jgi:hypothetical protein
MPQPAHRDARHTADRADAAHELVAIAVGQTLLTHQTAAHRPPLHFQSVTNPLSVFGAN